MKSHKRYFLVAVVVLSTWYTADAQTFLPSIEAPEQTVITAPVSSSFAFGRVLALENGILVVGDVYEDGPGFSGAAYVYRQVAGNNWRLEARLTAGPDSLTRYFGGAVALATMGDSTAIVVGSWNGAYVFKETEGSWKLSQHLVEEGTSFGWTLAVNDDMLVGRSEPGRFPLFRMSSPGVFTFEGEALVPSPGYGTGRILMLPNRIISRSSGIESSDPIRIQVLNLSDTSWAEEELLAPSTDAIDASVVAGLDSTLAIQFMPRQCCHSVRFYSYSGTEWAEESAIDSPVNVPTTFGSTIALFGDLAIIGAGLDPGGGVHNGAVYIYGRSGLSWQQRAKVTPWPNAPYFRLGGQSIATDGRYIAAHAEGDRKSIVVIDLSIVLSDESDAGYTAKSEVEIFPNPFGNTATISYRTSTSGHVQVRIIDLLGRIVAIPVDTRQNAGQHSFEWTPTTLARGHYFVVLTSGPNVTYDRVVYGWR